MKLLETIEQALHNVFNPAPHELKALICSLQLTPDIVAPYIAEPSFLPYGRTVLFQSEHIEAILIHLPKHSQTLIHDHGASVGCAFILEGELTNVIYRLDGYGYAQECGEGTVKQHQFLYAPQGQIHQMRNNGPERLLSFHIYTPRLSQTKVYHTYEQVLDYVI